MTPAFQNFLQSCENGPVEVCGIERPELVYELVSGYPDTKKDPRFNLSNFKVRAFLSKREDAIVFQIWEGDELVAMEAARPADDERPVTGRAAKGIN